MVNFSKHITVLQSTYISSIIGYSMASTIDDCCAFPGSLSICHQIGSARGMLILSEGVSVVRPDTLHWPWPWPTVWPTALSMTASCLLTLPEFVSLLGHERLMQYTWNQAADWFPYHPHLTTCALAATWQKNWPKMKIPNLFFSEFLRGSVSRVYRLQDRISMRYLHYPNHENTCSIKKLRTNM